MPHHEMNLPHLLRQFGRRPARVLAVAGCLSGAVVWPAAAQDTCYRVVDLGELGFSPFIDDIFGINNANQAVFTAVVNGKKHAMLYLPADAFGLTAGVHDLHTLANLNAAVESAAHDINNAGIAVGEADNHAFVWRVDQHDEFGNPPVPFIDLGLFPNGTTSAVFAITDDTPFPLMVGDGNRDGNCACGAGTQKVRLAFALELRDPPDPLINAALLVQDPGLSSCQPNTYGRDVQSETLVSVAGYSSAGGEDCIGGLGCGTGNAATSWLQPMPGVNNGIALAILGPDGGGTQAWGVSDTGATVGYGYDNNVSPCKEHALYWHTYNAVLPVDLGTATGIDGSDQSLAVRINNNQSPATLQAVGWKFGTPDLAFLWECDGNCNLLTNWSARDLNEAIQHCSDEWSIRRAFDVADNGWIIGMGRYAGQDHAILLTPLTSCSTAQCLGDLNSDGSVGVGDLLILLAAWGPCPAPPLPCDADLDCDGSVGVSDLLILLGEWRDECEGFASGPPQSIQDCIDRFCCDPEDELALITCLETFAP